MKRRTNEVTQYAKMQLELLGRSCAQDYMSIEEMIKIMRDAYKEERYYIFD